MRSSYVDGHTIGQSFRRPPALALAAACGDGTGPATSRNNPGTGDYLLTGNTFPAGDFRLDVVQGTNNVSGVVVGGPGVHNITTPVKDATVPALQPLLVRWTVPSKAKSAEVETRDFGPVTLPDTGAYRIAGTNNPARVDQRIRVFRFNEVDMAGGLIGSRLRVKVRKTVEPVVVQ